jgi:hypothetical protein
MTTNEQLVRELLASYFELEDEIKALEYDSGEIRKKLAVITKAAGGSMKVERLATLKVIEPSVSHSYDTAAIDALVATLLQDGETHTAHRLALARKETKRSESFRIVGQRNQ